MKPFLSNKENLGPSIKLVEKTSCYKMITKLPMNQTLSLKTLFHTKKQIQIHVLQIKFQMIVLDPVEKCINQYKFHPSILLVKYRIKIQNLFSFHAIDRNDMMKNMLIQKATTRNIILSKTLKLIADISADILQSLFNMLSIGNFQVM